MPFPTISLPNYEVPLPSKPELIYRFRPYVIKEEKVLFMTNLSEDKKEYSKAIRKLLVDCSLNPTFNEEFVEHLSYFDTEFLYLALRARSVGEIQEIEYTCNNMVSKNNDNELKEPCSHKVLVPVDFTKIEVEFPPFHANSIKLTDDITINFKYPSFEYVESFSVKLEQIGTDVNKAYEASLYYLSGLIDSVITADGVIGEKDFTIAEGAEWLQTLTSDSFNKIKVAYLDNVPRTILKTHFHCDKCGYDTDMTLEGLESFFE